MAEISADRVAIPKVTNFQVFNPGTFLAKFAKLRSSEVMKLLAKSFKSLPPGDITDWFEKIKVEPFSNGCMAFDEVQVQNYF